MGSRAQTRLLDGVFAGGREVSDVSLSGPLWSSPADGNHVNSKAVRKLLAETSPVSVVVKYKPCFWLKGLQSPSELLPITPQAPLCPPLRILLEMLSFDGWGSTSRKTLLQNRGQASPKASLSPFQDHGLEEATGKGNRSSGDTLLHAWLHPVTEVGPKKQLQRGRSSTERAAP